MPRVFSIRFGLALAFVFSLGTSRTDAGPTKYDPKTKSFRITYTFAALPSFGMSPDQIEQFGEIQKATPDQEANVRTIYKAVSVILEDVTARPYRFSRLRRQRQAGRRHHLAHRQVRPRRMGGFGSDRGTSGPDRALLPIPGR